VDVIKTLLFVLVGGALWTEGIVLNKDMTIGATGTRPRFRRSRTLIQRVARSATPVERVLDRVSRILG
jgi:hypothetical protein